MNQLTEQTMRTQSTILVRYSNKLSHNDVIAYLNALESKHNVFNKERTT